jgi:hypothetical protein
MFGLKTLSGFDLLGLVSGGRRPPRPPPPTPHSAAGTQAVSDALHVLERSRSGMRRGAVSPSVSGSAAEGRADSHPVVPCGESPDPPEPAEPPPTGKVEREGAGRTPLLELTRTSRTSSQP